MIESDPFSTPGALFGKVAEQAKEVVKNTHGGARADAGRKTLYYPELCDEMLDYFSEPPYVNVEIKNDEGDVIKVFQQATDFKSFEGFAASKGLSREVLFLWKRKHKLFNKTWRKCKAHQFNWIQVNGMAGRAAPTFAKLAAHALMGWQEKADVTSKNKHVNTTFTLKIGD